MAPLRHADGLCICLLIGVDRKSLVRGQNDAIDPQLTFFRKSFIVNAFAHIKGASITWNASSRVDHLFHPVHC